MNYLVNKIFRKCSQFLYVGALLIPLCVLVMILEIFFYEIREFSWYLLFIWMFMLLISVIITFLTVFLIRIYQIIDKWDQLFSIKNASKFLDLGIDGEKYLQFNLTQQEIWRLRERYQNHSAKPKS